MNACPRCDLPLIASPIGDLWCSVWGRHAHTSNVMRRTHAPLVALIIQHEDDQSSRHLRAVG